MLIPTNDSLSPVSDGTQPDVLLPQQFSQLWHRGAAATPVQRLALAVLLRAIVDLGKFRFARRLRHQKLYADAYVWITARREDEKGLSFVRICESFGIDPDAARAELLTVGAPSDAPARIIEWEEAA